MCSDRMRASGLCHNFARDEHTHHYLHVYCRYASQLLLLEEAGGLHQTALQAMSAAFLVLRPGGGEGRRKMTEPSASRSVS